MLEKRKYNPHIAFGQPLICNTTGAGAKLSFSKGFFAYQWERDGQIIPGATTAELIAATPGTYRGRFSRKANPTEADWERWSDPIVVSEMTPQQAVVEVIGTAHLRGPGLASTDENNTVQLKSADSAEFYQWYKDGVQIDFARTSIEDTARIATITNAFTSGNGAYTLITQNNNCPSPPSEPVNLFFNNSSPQNITLQADAMGFKGTVSSSSIFLSWNDISSHETGYEIWRRRAGSPDFKFVAKTSEDAVSYHDAGLDPSTTYEYKLRAVNNTGRSNYVPSDDLAVNYTFTTSGDFRAPLPPQNLKVVDNTLNTITLSWTAARDENTIKEYYIYYNNDSIATGSNATTYTLTGLPLNTEFIIKVRALDYGNHFSQPSNQVIGTTFLFGLVYKHSTGAWESLDDSSLVATWQNPEFTGTVNNFTLAPRTQEDYFNFQFTGYLNIETEGTYTFIITSNDGGRLILDGNVIADVDGIHGTWSRTSAPVYLTAGPHPIEVQYFDDVGAQIIQVKYQGPGVGDGVSFIHIPDAALRSGNYTPPVPPAAPTNATATGAGLHINLTWEFADDELTDYEVYRATNAGGPFQIVVRAKGTSAIDSIGLEAGKTYHYKVKTVSNTGTSGFSNLTSAATSGDIVPPSTPTNLTLINKTLSNVAFSWTASTDNIGVSGYEIYSGAELIGTSDIQGFTAENLSPNTQYSFTVKAVDASGNRSAASEALVVATNTSAIFYSLASGNLNELSSWRRNADGTGEAPQNFSDNGQFFMIANRTTASLAGPWVIGGNASRVIIPDGVTFTADQPFTAHVELQGSAVLNLNHDVGPNIVKVSPESTVNFNAYPTIKSMTYGNVILSGTVVKTFEGDTTTILGNLTVGENLALKGLPGNTSHVRLAGALTLNGTRPVTAADNAIDLAFIGTTAQTVTTGSDVHLFRIASQPGQNIEVINPASTSITIHLGSLKGGGLLLANGSALNINNHHLTLTNAGVINPGDLTGKIAVSGGDFNLSSSSAQHSHLYFDAVNHRINRLTLNLSGAGTVIVHSTLDVVDGIKINNGTLNAGGHIALLASADRTAVIYEIENAGRITGEVSVQEHIPAQGNIYRYLSSPVEGVNVAEWQQSFPITGSFAGASAGYGNAPSLFYYRQSIGGWVAYPPANGSNSAPIERGVGYSALFRNATDPVTITVKGNPYQGNVALPLAAGGQTAATTAFNFVGNPYASPIQWTTREGAWTKTGIGNVVAVRSNTVVNGQVRSQAIYYDLQLGGGTIPAGEGFWVTTTSATPALMIHEQAKVDAQAETPVTEPVQHLIVNLQQGELIDPAYILFTESGTDGFDALLDGRKLRNHGMFNLSSLTEDTVALAVNNLSPAFCSKNVNLKVTDVAPGNYTFTFENLESLPEIGQITLIDHFTGANTAVNGNAYAFTVTDDPASYGAGRFTLSFVKQQLDVTTPQITGGDVCSPGPGAVVIANSQEGVLYQVVNASDKVISDMIQGNGETIEIPIFDGELTAGANTVRVTAGFTGCDRQTLATNVTLNFISELTITTASDVIICEGDDVTLEASGAPAGGFYRWFDSDGVLIEGASGSTLLVADVTEDAIYFVSAAHANGCESGLAEIHIFPDTLAVPVIEMKDDTLYADVQAYYQWKKDGEDIPGATQGYYVPLEDGNYTVVASNGGCFKESEPFQFGDPEPPPVTGIENGNNPEFVLNIYPVPSPGHRIHVSLRSPKTEPVLIEIIDALGRIHYSKTLDVSTLMQGAELVPSATLYNGIYFLRATQADIRARKKIIVNNDR
ncbi:MAG TPA: fibronectin type III domain-containing protein [Chryseosolibacter sp.]|nr:fibronectin type III domain-containing protein [Chryseosolibacter sp.]